VIARRFVMTTSGDDVVATAVDFLERQLVG
jgi:hypothetical protein